MKGGALSPSRKDYKMVIVKYKKVNTETGCAINLSINGHANYGKKGKDILCAAISIMAHHLFLGCGRYEVAKKCNINCSYIQDGDAKLYMTKCSDEVQFFVDLTVDTLDKLSKVLDYSKHLNVIAEDWSDEE